MTILLLITISVHIHIYMYMTFDTFYISSFLVVPSVDQMNINKLLTICISLHSYNYQIASIFGSRTKIQVGPANAPKLIAFQSAT